MTENKCYECKYMIDNGEGNHFNRCTELGICVDCDPYECKGKLFKRKK